MLGAKLPHRQSRKGYTGHLKDSGSDLVYMKARYYDPVIGRFYSNDPVGFTTANPMMFNRYAYANNNPYRYIDPQGTSPEGIDDDEDEDGLPDLEDDDFIRLISDFGGQYSNGFRIQEIDPGVGGGGRAGAGKTKKEGVTNNALDAFSKSGATEKFSNGLTRAGHAFEKHASGQRKKGSSFPKLSGNPAEKSAIGQRILDDILTDPGTIRSSVTGGHFPGGTRFTAPDGRQAVFDKNNELQYFGE